MTEMLDQEEFQYWLFRMPDILTEFTDFMASEHSVVLDYSVESLSVLEAWLNSTYSSHLDILKFDQKSMLDGCARYLGEVIRKLKPLKWKCDFSNSNDAHYAIPFLDSRDFYVPRYTVTTACHRKTGSFIEERVKHLVNSL